MYKYIYLYLFIYLYIHTYICIKLLGLLELPELLPERPGGRVPPGGGLGAPPPTARRGAWMAKPPRIVYIVCIYIYIYIYIYMCVCNR